VASGSGKWQVKAIVALCLPLPVASLFLCCALLLDKHLFLPAKRSVIDIPCAGLDTRPKSLNNYQQQQQQQQR